MECSKPINDDEEGYGEQRICLSCIESKSAITATRHEENWRSLNSNIDYLDNEFLFNDKLSKIPILRNGNDNKLEFIRIDEKLISLTNTCPFDSLFQICLSTFLDRDIFRERIQQLADENHFLKMILDVATGRTINHGTYVKRAEISYRLNEEIDENRNPEDCVIITECKKTSQRRKKKDESTARG